MMVTENQARKIFQKAIISYPVICTRVPISWKFKIVFQKALHALVSCYHYFEILSFAVLPTVWPIGLWDISDY